MLRRIAVSWRVLAPALTLASACGLAGAAQRPPPLGAELPASQEDPQQEVSPDATASTDAPPAEQVPAAQIEARIAALRAIDSPTDVQKRELALLEEAGGYLTQIAEADRQAATFTREAADIEARVAALQEEIDRPPPGPLEGVGAAAEQEELTALLAAARTALASEQQALKTLEADSQHRTARRVAIPQERQLAQEQIDRLEGALSAAAKLDEPQELRQAQRWRLLAEKQAHEATIRLLDAELASYDARVPLRVPRQQAQAKRIALAEQKVAALTQALDQRRQRDAQQREEEARRTSVQAVAAHPIARAIYEENTRIAAEMSDVLQRVKQHAQQRDRSLALLSKWRDRRSRMQNRIERLGGYTEAIGIELRRWLIELREVAVSERTLREVRSEQNRVQLRMAEIAEELNRLADKETYAAALLAESESPVPLEQEAEVAAQVMEALRARERDFLIPLDQLYDDYSSGTLIDLVEAERLLIATTDELRRFVEEHVLWIQSAPPLRSANVDQLRAALAWLLNLESWRGAARAAMGGLRASWALHAVMIAVLGLLIVLRQRIKRAIGDINAAAQRPSFLSYGATLASIALVLLLALPGPLVLMLLASSLQGEGDPTSFTTKLAAGFGRIAALLLLCSFMSNLCREDGTAHVQFHWRAASCRLLRRHLRWFVPLLLPLSFLHTITNQDPFDPHQDSLGRAAFMAAMIVCSVFIWRLLNTRTGILQEFVARQRGGWLDRLRHIWFPAMALAPAGLALLAGLGYFYTAIQLELRTLSCVMLILAAVVFSAMIMRWLVVSQRRLAIDQARRRIKQLTETGTEAETEAAKIIDAANKIDVEALTRQSRRLVRFVIGSIVLLAVALIWSDVLPAFNALQDIELGWTRSVVKSAGSTVDGAIEGALEGGVEGAKQAGGAGAVERSDVPVTLLDLLRTLVILTLTFIIGRNLPAMMEITVLQRLPLSSGGRYATSTLVRYAIYIIGVVWALDGIGLGWSKVQWLAAAITVGLGFGLQEIVANFVSGIIILFEQPIRVGDTVTVGDKSGTVSRIRMRATTIVDWDRKEHIIPNKEFVTGQIVNWTLSDTTLRITVPVGVEYGTDPQLVKRVLLEAAKKVEHVAEDPAPMALFRGFGDSSLDFELRVFIPHINHLLTVKDSLLAAVTTAFDEAGVVIAFPQREIRIRSISAPVRFEQVAPVERDNTSASAKNENPAD